MAALTDLAPPVGARRPSGAASWVMMWTLAGAGSVSQGAASVEAEPGWLVVLGARVGHQYGVRPGERHWVNWWAHFQPRAAWLGLLKPFLVGPRAYLVGPVASALRPAVTDAWRRLHAYLRWSGTGALPSPPAARAQAARAAIANHGRAYDLGLTTLEEVVTLVTSAATEAEPRPAGAIDPRLRRVLAYIAADPGAGHTVTSLARVASVSSSRLAHLFTEQVGRTPMQAVRASRVAYAARLLEATDLSVAQVAHAAGFASPFHFSRTFTAAFGQPPSRYRQQARQP